MSQGIINPGWKPNEKRQRVDPIDQIYKGLQIAQAAYGIYSDYEKLDIARKAQADAETRKQAELGNIEAQTKLREAELKKIENERPKEDRLSQKDVSAMYKEGWRDADENTRGAVKFATYGGDKWYVLTEAPKPVKFREIEGFDPKSGQNVIVSVPEGQPVPKGLLAPRRDQQNAKPTEGESNYADYGTRMDRASKVLTSVEDSGFDAAAASNLMSKVPLVGNYVISKEAREYNTAKRDFISAILRKQSGATIKDEEFLAEDIKYFPQPGDEPKDIAYKRRLRREATDNFLALGGKATEKLAPKTLGQKLGLEAAAGPSPQPTLPFDPRDYVESL